MHIIPLYFILYTDHHLNLFIPNSIRLLFIFYISFFYFGIKKKKFEKQSVYDRLQSFLVYRQQSDIMKETHCATNEAVSTSFSFSVSEPNSIWKLQAVPFLKVLFK